MAPADEAPEEVTKDMDDEEEDTEGRPMRLGTKVLVGLAVLGAVWIAMYALWYALFPTYTAEAYIECISPVPKAPYSIHPAPIPKWQHDRFLQDQALYVKQPDILMEVLRSPEVRATGWYASVDERERLGELEDALNCSPIRDSNCLRVSMGTRSPKDPHLVVGKAVDIYLREAKERATGQFRLGLAKMEEERDGLDTQIDSQMRQIGLFAAALPEGVLGQEQRSGMTVVEAELLAAQQQVTEYRLQTLELKGLYELCAAPQAAAVTAEDRALVESDPLIVKLREEHVFLQVEYESNLPQTEENKAQLEKVQKRLKCVEQALQRVREQRLREMVELKCEKLRTAFLNSQHTLLFAEDRLVEKRAKQKDVERRLQEYQRLKDELEFLKEAREKATEYAREVRRIVAERSAVQIELLQPPVPPLQRDEPQWHVAAIGPGVFVVYAILLGLYRHAVGRRSSR